METGLQFRRQVLLDDHLRDAVGHRRDAQRSRAPNVLPDLHPPHRRWEVAAGGHPVPELMGVAPDCRLELRQRLPVDAGCTAVRLHPLIRFPNELLRNVVRLCLRHGLLPSLVGRHHWPDRRASSLRLHYQASSLRRARPPLCLALVSPPHGSSTRRSPLARIHRIDPFRGGSRVRGVVRQPAASWEGSGATRRACRLDAGGR